MQPVRELEGAGASSRLAGDWVFCTGEDHGFKCISRGHLARGPDSDSAITLPEPPNLVFWVKHWSGFYSLGELLPLFWPQFPFSSSSGLD